MRSGANVAAALVVAALVACRSLPPEPPPPPWPAFESAELGSAPNVHRAGDLWIGGRPERADLELALRRGLVRVIDISAAQVPAVYDIDGAARAQGLDYVRIPFGTRAPERDAVERALVELRRPGAKYLFCDGGEGAALVLAIHRVLDHGVPLDQALVEARRLGMKPGLAEDFVRGYCDA